MTFTRHRSSSETPGLRTTNKSLNATRDTTRELLQRRPQLDRSDPSSPIGTFAGQILGRLDRSLGPSRIGPAHLASRAVTSKTIGLSSRNPAGRVTTRARATTRCSRQTKDANANDDENAGVLPVDSAVKRKEKPTKLGTDDKVVQNKRRRIKIQRLQLRGAAPASSADQPLSDADHHLNSQPDALEPPHADLIDAADESEISYFPTLPPRMLSDKTPNGIESRQDHTPSISDLRAADDPLFPHVSDPIPSTTSLPSRTRLREGQDEDLAREELATSQEDLSVGLLEVLSQNAIRKIDKVQTSRAVSPKLLGPSDSALVAPTTRSSEAQHHVEIDFDPSHFSHQQAHRIAKVISESEIKVHGWTSVDPDLIPRQIASQGRSSETKKVLQAAWRPPSSRNVARDLGLSSSQLLKTPCADAPDFVHSTTAGSELASQKEEEEDLAPFEHRPCSAGYRLHYVTDEARNEAGAFKAPLLEPFNADALRKRMQTRRKEVVKIIIPFSEPSLSILATGACHLKPDPSLDLCSRAKLPSKNSVRLVWMQSTAHHFLHAMDNMVQADSADLAQGHSCNNESAQLDMYSCPILHYVAHTDTAPQKESSSYVALYVHLDRLAEAHLKLADLDLSDGREAHGYRPFRDPLVRVLVTSIRGEPLGLI